MQDLRTLARFAHALEDPAFKAGAWNKSKEVERGVSTFPYVSYDEVTKSFVEAVYEDGWVMADFDWPQWISTEEARNLRAGGAAVQLARPEQLARILTALIRQDRFSEGTLFDAFEAGLILQIVKRGEALLNESASLGSDGSSGALNDA